MEHAKVEVNPRTQFDNVYIFRVNNAYTSFLPFFTQLNSYLPHILLNITSFLLPIWSTFFYEASLLSLFSVIVKTHCETDGSFAALVAGGGAALELIKPDIWPFSSLARVKLRCQPKIIFHHKHVSVTNSSFEKNLPILDTGVQLSYQDDKGVPKYSILLR